MLPSNSGAGGALDSAAGGGGGGSCVSWLSHIGATARGMLAVSARSSAAAAAQREPRPTPEESPGIRRSPGGLRSPGRMTIWYLSYVGIGIDSTHINMRAKELVAIYELHISYPFFLFL